MKTDRYETVIIGGGPSGISSGSLLAEYSVNTLLIDEHGDLGGHLWRGPIESSPFGKLFGTPDKRIDISKTTGYRNGKLRVAARTNVVGIFPDQHTLLLSSPRGLQEIKADKIIFATGAREKVHPFDGWTLPGVMTVGAAQTLLKNHSVVAASDILIGGAGPLLYLLGSNVLRNNGSVTAILDRSPVMDVLASARLMRGQMSKLGQGFSALSCLLKNRVSMKYQRQIIKVEEKKDWLEVTAVKLLPDGTIAEGSEERFQTRLVAVTNGFAGNIELPQLAGCDLEYSTDKGGWAVKVDSGMQSSVENIFATGEITGIGGGDKAVIEGKLAALSILHQSERITQKNYEEKRKALLVKHKRCLRFAAHLNHQWAISGQEWDDISDNTIICRCEDVTMGTLRSWINEGTTSAAVLKKATRCSMGNCQGRTCGPLIYQILRTYAPGTALAGSDLFSVRVPVKPIPFVDLAKM